MAVPQDKSELLAAIDKTYAALRRDLAAISPERTVDKTLEGHAKGTIMSVHDLVAYLLGWNLLVLKWLERDRAQQPIDFPETGYKWNELGRLAQKFYADHVALSFPDLLAALDKAKSEIVAAIEAASLYGRAWYEKWTLGRMIQFNTASPYANARGRLSKWRKAQGIN
jgi:hypothetical protein